MEFDLLDVSRMCLFKRSAMPDGPKVGSVALSPRGDWRMPSDASSALWQHELEEMVIALLNR